MGKCIICGNTVDWDIVKEEFDYILAQADAHGVESLTENQQVVYEGLVCSDECYNKLE